MRIAALPFIITKSTDAYSIKEYTSTTETAHGLLRVDDEHLVIQWRLKRTTDRMGVGYSSEESLEPIREVSIALTQLASATLRRPWWLIGRGPRLVLTATELRAFEGVAGPTGLALAHPSQLELQLHRRDADLGREFAVELELAISEHQLRVAEGSDQPRLDGGEGAAASDR